MLISLVMLLQFPPLPPVHVTFEESWLARWDFCLTLFTFALASVTGWLAWETRTLRKDGAEGVAAAGRSAGAAERSVGIALETMHSTLRAYVVVKGIETTEDEGKVAVSITNTGQTPSQNQYCFCSVRETDKIPDKSEFEGTEIPYNINEMLSVNQIRVVTRTAQFRVSGETSTTQVDPQFLILHGLIRYRDIFTDKPHVTAFCYQWDPRYQEWYPVGPLNYLQ